MSRDFAHKPKETSHSSAKVPRWALLLTIIFVGGLGGFLYYLSTHVSSKDSAAAQAAAEAKMAEFQSKLPSKPENSKSTQATKTTSKPIVFTTAAPAKASANVASKAATTAPTAEPKTVDFTFYDTLSKGVPDVVTAQEQKAARAKSLLPTEHRWNLQIASFRELEKAERVRGELILNGFTTAYISKSGSFNVVTVGPFDNEIRTDQAKLQIQKLGHQPLKKKIQ